MYIFMLHETVVKNACILVKYINIININVQDMYDISVT